MIGMFSSTEVRVTCRVHDERKWGKKRGMKKKIDLIKLQSFCKAKDTVNKTKGNQLIGKRSLPILHLVEG